MKEVTSYSTTMGLFNRKKATKAERNKTAQRNRELKVMMYGGLCGLILALTPILAIGLTPGHITRDYISGQIMFSTSSGGTTPTALGNLINTRLNSDKNNPLDEVIIGELDPGTSNTLGQEVAEINTKLDTALGLLGATPPQPASTPPTTPQAQPTGTIIVTDTQLFQRPSSTLYVAAGPGNGQVVGIVEFELEVIGVDTTLNQFELSAWQSRGELDKYFSNLTLDVDGVGSTGNIDILNNKVRFSNLGIQIPQGSKKRLTVYATIQDINITSVRPGSSRMLYLQAGAFQPANGGILTDSTGSSLNSRSARVMGTFLEFHNSAPIFTDSTPRNYALATGMQSMFIMGLDANGKGNLAIGDGYQQSQLVFQLNIKSGSIAIDRCQLMAPNQTQNPLLAEIATPAIVQGISGVNAAPIYLVFNGGDFLQGQSITPTGPLAAMLECNITNITPGTTVSIDMPGGGRTTMAETTDPTSVIYLNDPTSMNGLPLVGYDMTTP